MRTPEGKPSRGSDGLAPGPGSESGTADAKTEEAIRLPGRLDAGLGTQEREEFKKTPGLG